MAEARGLMARRALGPAQWAVAEAVGAALDAAGPTIGDRAGAVPAAGVLVAVSGGADSLALAAGAFVATRRRGLGCRAVTVDHGLQPGSDDVARAAVGQLGEWGVPGQIVRVAVGTAGGLEAAARAARYAALARTAAPDEWVLLGHTLDDQAETVLLGLARGSGTRSLAGMPARRGRFLRPLLGLRRVLVAEAAAAWGAAPHHDPHNEDRRFARVRVRAEALPVLETALGPGIAEALARTARLARADADLLDAQAAAVGDPADCATLAALPGPLRTRAVKAWLERSGAADLREAHVAAVADLAVQRRGRREVDVPGLRVTRRGDRLEVVAGEGPTA
ncbi:tRNA lysidine(34) synthetase TilS [Propionicicella superfundia]|uniref:tRNA lysidine(34) synthetase TilS n=1 Tax=Propionicicella superfundia TaxID=348582 RepID=UPI0004195C23|nr:tRNA lysidine(34) synthetase TilS [Propionicicella superfundia]